MDRLAASITFGMAAIRVVALAMFRCFGKVDCVNNPKTLSEQ